MKQASPSRRTKSFSVDLLFRTVGAGYFNEYRDIYVSHPYTHRRLVEFALAAPFSQFLRNGQTRSLMRRAFGSLLPRRICGRVSKGAVDESIIRALQREWAGISDLRQWSVCQRGLIDPGRFSESLDQMRLGMQHLSGPLTRLFSLERWLRSLGHNGTDHTPTIPSPSNLPAFSSVRKFETSQFRLRWGPPPDSRNIATPSGGERRINGIHDT